MEEIQMQKSWGGWTTKLRKNYKRAQNVKQKRNFKLVKLSVWK